MTSECEVGRRGIPTAEPRLTQSRFDGDGFGARWRQWNQVALNRSAVDFERNHIARAGASYFDLIAHTAKLPRGSKTRPVLGDHGFNPQSVVVRAHAEYPLRCSMVVPGGSARKP